MLAGCGRIDFDPLADAGGDGKAPADACAFGPWSQPELDLQLSTNNEEFGPALTADGLEVFFHSDRPGGMGSFDLFHATRGTQTQAWGAPTLVANVNSTASDGGAALTLDGRTMYFDSNRGGSTQLYVTTRPDRTSPFGAPALVPALVDVAGVTISSDGTEMFGSSSANMGDLVRVTGYDTATPVIEPLTSLNTPASEGYPTISSDGLTLYYSFEYDIARARRPAIGASFVAEGVEAALSSATSDDDAELSRDGTIFMQASVRTSGNDDIYVSTRSCQ